MKLTTPPAQGTRPGGARPRRIRPLLAGWLLGTVLLTGTLASCAGS